MTLQRPKKLNGVTIKLKLDHLDYALYVTINTIETSEGVRPFEVFINSKNAKLVEPMSVLTRLLSAILRQGGNIEYVFDELSDTLSCEPFMYRGSMYYSLASVVGKVLKDFCKKIGYKDGDKT